MELNEIVAMNLVELRKEHNLTQAELAAKLNYTDKAISKWERAESIPELATLKQLADMFGVTIDYITSEKPKNEKKEYLLPRAIKTNRILITAITTSIVFIISTVAFVYAVLYQQKFVWSLFVWSIPASMICLYVFNRMWGKKIYNFYITSIFVWTFLTGLFLETMQYNTWLIFIVGVPIQIMLVLIAFLKK